jgi:hypothetical protein
MGEKANDGQSVLPAAVWRVENEILFSCPRPIVTVLNSAKLAITNSKITPKSMASSVHPMIIPQKRES